MKANFHQHMPFSWTQGLNANVIHLMVAQVYHVSVSHLYVYFGNRSSGIVSEQSKFTDGDDNEQTHTRLA